MIALSTTDWLLIGGFVLTGIELERIRETLIEVRDAMEQIHANTTPDEPFEDYPPLSQK